MRSMHWVIAVALWACDSNPTPHPGQDAGATQTADTNTGGGPPIDEGDGLEDCMAAGGYWDGNSCRDGVTGAADAGGDTALEPAADTGDAMDAGDAEDGEVDDAEDDEIGDAEDAEDAGDGQHGADGESRDTGPDDQEPDASR
jgi:hypothetical protein